MNVVDRHGGACDCVTHTQLRHLAADVLDHQSANPGDWVYVVDLDSDKLFAGDREGMLGSATRPGRGDSIMAALAHPAGDGCAWVIFASLADQSGAWLVLLDLATAEVATPTVNAPGGEA